MTSIRAANDNSAPWGAGGYMLEVVAGVRFDLLQSIIVQSHRTSHRSVATLYNSDDDPYRSAG
jgi:hypothetical protein